MNLEIVKQLLFATALSSLVGLEREQKLQKYGKGDFAGIRTFTLTGLIGCFSFLMRDSFFLFPVVVSFGFFSILILSYWLSYLKYNDDGATSEVAAILVYIIGVLCGMGEISVAVFLALVVSIVLHFKSTMHLWAKHLKNEELVSTIQFIIIAFVVLPLLPDKGFGPYQFFNPSVVWEMVVFISGISFVSYVVMKFIGTKKGVIATGFLAGFISSTALALAFSGKSKENPRVVYPYVAAVIIACTAMFFRILVEVFYLSEDLFKILIVPMGVMGVVGVLALIYFTFKNDESNDDVSVKMTDMESPFSLVPALKFGLFFAFILFFVKFANDYIGDSGTYLVGVVSGVLDVDAITLSMAQSVRGGFSPMGASYTITLAAITNTIVKGGFFMLFGGKKVMIRVISVFSLMVVFGAVSLLFI